MIRRPCSSGSRAWSSRPEPKSPEEEVSLPAALSVPSRQQAEEKMARSRQREEGPPLARFLRRSVSTKDRRVCPLDFFTPGAASCRRVRQRMPHGCGLLEARAPLSFPRYIGPQTKRRRLKYPSRHTGRLAARRPEPRTKVQNKRDVPCTGASLVLLSAVSRPLVSSLMKRIGKRTRSGRRAPFLRQAKTAPRKNISPTTWAARWDRRTSSRSAGDRWRSGPWRR